jgi:hypothetical protein
MYLFSWIVQWMTITINYIFWRQLSQCEIAPIWRLQKFVHFKYILWHFEYFDCVIFDLTWTKNSINDNKIFYSYDMYSKCHRMYLKWTYFCNRHMGAISHWESCSQNSKRHLLHDSPKFITFRENLFQNTYWVR